MLSVPFVCDVEKDMTGKIVYPLSHRIAAVDNRLRCDNNKRSKYDNVESKLTNTSEGATAQI